MTSFKELFVEFTDESTIHGLRKACRSKSITLRVLWTIFLLASTCLFSYQISRLVEKYNRYQINVKTTEERLPLVPPTVKICNLTPVPVMYFVLYDNYFILRYIKTLAAIKNVSIDDVKFGKWRISWELFDTFNITSEEELYDEYRIYMYNLFGGNSATFPLSAMGDIGIFDVQVNGQELYYDIEYDADFGICITIPIKEVNLKRSDQSVIEMMLFVGQKDYIPLFVSSAGYRVGLAESGTNPDMTRSFLIPPGFKTELAIQQVISYKLSEPHGQCYNGSYYHSIAECERECLSVYVYNTCNCTLHDKAPVSLCSINDVCVKSVIGMNYFCECFEPCRRHDYDVTPSFTQYPSDAYLPIVYKAFNDFDPNNNFSSDEIRRNTAAFRVYFRIGTTIVTEEEEAYSFENLMSDIGGQLGLGLGVSVLSMLELIGFIIDIVNRFFQRISLKNSQVLK